MPQLLHFEQPEFCTPLYFLDDSFYFIQKQSSSSNSGYGTRLLRYTKSPRVNEVGATCHTELCQVYNQIPIEMFQRTAISEDKSFVYSLGRDLRIEEAKKVSF
jgi:hypothetical protein